MKLEFEDGYKKNGGSGNSTETAYTVEARYNYSTPIQIGKQLFDIRWQRVEFVESIIGVPSCASYQRETVRHGMLGYSAAQALRWWLHAAADADKGGYCLETRLVSHKIISSYNIEAKAVHEYIGGEDRSNCLPDQGVE